MPTTVEGTVAKGAKEVKGMGLTGVLSGVAGIMTGVIIDRGFDPSGRIGEAIASRAKDQNGAPLMTEGESDFFGFVIVAIFDIAIIAGSQQTSGGLKWFGTGFGVGNGASAALQMAGGV